ncbi:biopolymer transporter ExbD [Opitutus sp. ER46]|uniref:ExbD/TolR family protein n=1 Tax=Opitutus sp. ER46 TaxID=2161864 RepID=UPI000D319B4D|nr:biopolymer transporter ExbD [Opitutus sp. ER46]PTX94194.1 biopolymer transporter ExbD [Opitutus sp. ER46]
MARNFRRTRSVQPIADLNVTNLIDLGFMLLIIFMIVANPTIQKEQTIPVNLPEVSKAPEQKSDPNDVFMAVGVDAQGRFYIENKNAPIGMAELRSQLRAYALQSKPPVIRIRGDSRVPYQKVAELFNEVQKAGLTRFTIDAQSQD